MLELAQANWPILQNLSAKKIFLTTEELLAMSNANWPLLLSLDLSFNNLTSKLPALNSAKWPLLKRLTLNRCRLTGSDLHDLVALPLPSLRHLFLTGNKFG
jgi:hypothetical protein